MVISRTGGALVMLALAACSSVEVRPVLFEAGPLPDAERAETSTFACASPQDCAGYVTEGPDIFCCIHSVCIVGWDAEAQTCIDPASQNIVATSYDQSCQTDSDCVAVEVGNFCKPGAHNNCTNAAINKGALPQYNADLARTQAGVCAGLSGCTAEFGPCCKNGTCLANYEGCGFGIVDAGPETGDADAK